MTPILVLPTVDILFPMQPIPRRLVLVLLLPLLLLPVASAHAQLGTADSAPDHDERVKQQLDAEGWTYEIDEDGDFKMVVGFDDEDRSQLVYVISTTMESGDLEVREVWSPVYTTDGPLPAKIARWALDRAWDQIVGSLASNGGTVYFVAKIDAKAPPEVLSRIIRVAASTGDELEKEQEVERDTL
jgi:hypothetical protein